MDSTRPVYIYVLRDPTTGSIRYVGQSVNPQARYGNHCSAHTNHVGKVRAWIRALKAAGLRPEMEVIDQATRETAIEVEAATIRRFREEGADLLNRPSDFLCVRCGEKAPEALRLSVSQPGKSRTLYFHPSCALDSIAELSEQLSLPLGQIPLLPRG